MKKRTFILTSLAVFMLALTGCQAVAPNSTSSLAPAQTNTAAQTNAPASSSSTSAQSSFELTEEDAKEIALTDAALKEEDIIHIRIEKDLDDGIAVYDVEFYSGNKEYDYEIDAATGEIRSQDFDIEQDFGSQTSNSSENTGLLSKEEASAIVLAKVEGATTQNLRIVLDRDDGMDIYEGEIFYNGTEYEFELNAETGEILEWSQEKEND